MWRRDQRVKESWKIIGSQKGRATDKVWLFYQCREHCSQSAYIPLKAKWADSPCRTLRISETSEVKFRDEVEAEDIGLSLLLITGCWQPDRHLPHTPAQLGDWKILENRRASEKIPLGTKMWFPKKRQWARNLPSYPTVKPNSWQA